MPFTGDGTLPRGVDAVGLDVRLVRRRPKLVRRFHDRGHLVYVWTVDRDEDVDLCLMTGVDAVITNRPRHVIDRITASR